MPTISSDFASSTLDVVVDIFDGLAPIIYLILGVLLVALILSMIIRAMHK